MPELPTAIRDRLSRKTGLALLLLAALLVWPEIAPTSYYIHVFIRIFLFMTLVSSWNVVGYTGYINFGHAAFYGIGAYVVGLSIVMLDVASVIGVVLGGIIAGLSGLVLGIISIRVRGNYFAIISLLFLLIASIVFLNITDIIPNARVEILLPVWDVDIHTLRATFYYIFLALTLGYLLFSVWLERSKLGYAMRAIHEDEDLALSLGVPTILVKNFAIVTSTFMAGIVGGVFVLYTGYIEVPLYFALSLTFLIVFIGFIGGMGTWSGPIWGVLLFIPADEFLSGTFGTELAQILFGILFVIAVLAWPGGISRNLRDLYENRKHGDGLVASVDAFLH